jgi:hypothetical protein
MVALHHHSLADLHLLKALPAYQSNLIALSSPTDSLQGLVNFELTKTLRFKNSSKIFESNPK